MADVNPILHLDHDFMWCWYEVDDRSQTVFLSAQSFFSREDCMQDYETAMQRSKINLN